MVDNNDSFAVEGTGSPNSLIRHKIVFVGDLGVGKTSIIYRLLENKFKENYEVNSNLHSHLLE